MKVKTSVRAAGYVPFTNRRKTAAGRKATVSLAGIFSLALLFPACLEPIGPLGISGEISRLAVTAPPSATEYPRGSPFEVAGIEIKLLSNGWVRNVTAEVTYSWNDGTGDAELKPGDTAVTAQYGAKEITVTYESGGLGLRASFTISVLADDKLEGIFVTERPAREDYGLDQPFDPDGIRVMLFTGGGPRDVTGEITYGWNGGRLEPGDTAATARYGRQEIKVIHGGSGFETAFGINVLSDVPGDGLVVTGLPNLQYPRNSPFDPAGIEVMLFEGGFAKNVTEGVTYGWNGSGLLPGSTSITAQYGAKEVTVSYGGRGTFFRIEVLSDAELDGIFVTVPPALTEYRRNQPFDPAGIRVMLFTGGGPRDVTGETAYFWNGAGLKPGDTSATAGFGRQEIKVIHGGSGFEASFGISVLSDPVGDGLVVTGLPNLRYPRNGPFDTAGIEVMLFEGGFARNVTPDVGYFWNGTELKPGDTSVTAAFGAKEIKVAYGGGAGNFGTVFGIEVLSDEKLEGIFVTKLPPELLQYGRDDPFNITGIEVMFFDGGGAINVTKNVTYSWNNGAQDAELKPGDTSITATFGAKTVKVKYGHGGAGFETVFGIEVLSDETREGLVVTRLPDSTKYERNQGFGTDGIEVMLFRNGGAIDVTGSVAYGWDGGKLEDVTKEFGTKKITVSHNGRSVFDTAAFWIEVSPADGRDPDRLEITLQPRLTVYPAGTGFDPEGIRVVLGGDGWERDVTGEVGYGWSGGELKPGDTSVTAQYGARSITVSHGAFTPAKPPAFRIDVVTNHFIVTNSAEWQTALAIIDTQTRDRSFVITLRGDFEIPAMNSPSLPGRADGIDVTLRTLKGEKANLTLDVSQGRFGSALYITEKQTFTIDGEGLTFTGAGGNSFPLIQVEGSGARLELKNGTITANNNTIAGGDPGDPDLAGNGGGVRVADGGHFAMSGGAVSGNLANRGGGVAVYEGSFAMTGGSVSGNTCTSASSKYQGGGGVSLATNSTFIMSGRSSVSGNHAQTMGGGIFVQSGSTVTMLDESSIAGNECVRFGGGGIWLGNQSAATLNMKGGIISGNSGPIGAGVYSWSGGVVQMENGVIYGDDAPADLANIKIGEDGDPGQAAALRLLYGEGYRGRFTNGIFNKTDDFNAVEDNTLMVRNGDLVPYP